MVLKMLSLGSLLLISAPCLAQTCAVMPADKPAIEGHYIDNYGGVQDVLDHYWISGQYAFQICSVDNVKHQIIALNEAGNQSDAGKFSRFDWVRYSNRLWYCQTVFNASTEAEAAAAPPADPADPRIGGCGGKFEWSSLSKLAP